MSQKRHSCLLGTRLAGLLAASQPINASRFCMNLSSTAVQPEASVGWCVSERAGDGGVAVLLVHEKPPTSIFCRHLAALRLVDHHH